MLHTLLTCIMHKWQAKPFKQGFSTYVGIIFILKWLLLLIYYKELLLINPL